MKCLKCGEDNDRVINTRPRVSRELIYRRRECLGCGYRWRTHEKTVSPAGVEIPYVAPSEALQDFIVGMAAVGSSCQVFCDICQTPYHACEGDNFVDGRCSGCGGQQDNYKYFAICQGKVVCFDCWSHHFGPLKAIIDRCRPLILAYYKKGLEEIDRQVKVELQLVREVSHG